MILRAAALMVLMALPVAGQEGGQGVAGQGVAGQAGQAAADLQRAVSALQSAKGAKDRVAALTQTIGAYESGLGVLREALRQASLRETALTLQFNAQRERIGQLVAVLAQLSQDPGPLLMMHPSGPLGTVRSGMMLADVTPAVQGEAMRLKGALAELRELRELQIAAGDTLARGLKAAQDARSALSQAMSDRTDLPRRFTEDPAELRQLLESADTLDAFASGLAPIEDDENYFITAKGRLPFPARGSVLRRPGEADAAGVARPGLTLSVRPRALVTAPWPSTIRYVGPLLDYGNVIILEPGGGYLLVLAGLQTVYGEVGEVVAAGAPLGLMGGTDPTLADLMAVSEDAGGTRETETLYVEVRQGADPVNPEEWFAEGRD